MRDIYLQKKTNKSLNNKINTNKNSINISSTNNIDYDLFDRSCMEVIGRQQGANGIGTLSEKTVHAVLKYYYAPKEKYHEVRIGNYVADICREGEIFEIQTRNFNTLRSKLDCFLQDHDVTIVYPIANIKYLRWVNPDTGEILPPRKCPKKGNIYNIIPELYKIKYYLPNENLHFIMTFLDMEEYRMLDGWSKDKKKGATKTDKIPTGIAGEIRIDCKEDYLKFLPDDLPENFTSKDVAVCCKISIGLSGVLLHILHYLNLIERTGKKGNAYLYKIL